MSTRLSADVRPFMLSEADRHLVSRFSYGLDERLVGEVRAAGSSQKWFERQLDHLTIDDRSADAVRSWYPLLGHDPATKFRNSRSGGPGAYDYGLAFVNHWMAHAMLTSRHVHAQMTSFWGNLLYVNGYEDRSFPWRFDYDQTIRTHALTSYRQLLRACIVHPSMTAWLNNNESTARGINENLGRELLELFTVGRTGGYTEDHVKDCARLLTGFRTREGDALRVWYDPSKHATGPVTILGFRHANSSPDGRAAVNALLDYLALHPATARRIAYRLCQRFVNDSPPGAIVSAVAAAYTSSRSDIRSTLRALVKHPQFAATRRARLRTPIEDVISTVRSVGSRPTRPTNQETSLVQHAVWMATDAGQGPFRWPRPDGYPEVSTAYASPARLISSWNHHLALIGNAWKSTAISQAKAATFLPASWPRRLDELVEHQSRLLLGRPTDPLVLQAVSDIIRRPRNQLYTSASAVDPWHLTVIRATILSLPEAMKR